MLYLVIALLVVSLALLVVSVRLFEATTELKRMQSKDTAKAIVAALLDQRSDRRLALVRDADAEALAAAEDEGFAIQTDAE